MRPVCVALATPQATGCEPFSDLHKSDLSGVLALADGELDEGGAAAHPVVFGTPSCPRARRGRCLNLAGSLPVRVPQRAGARYAAHASYAGSLSGVRLSQGRWGPSESICKGGDGGTPRQHYGIKRASLRDEFPLSGDRVPHRRTTATPQHSGEWSLQGVSVRRGQVELRRQMRVRTRCSRDTEAGPGPLRADDRQRRSAEDLALLADEGDARLFRLRDVPARP